MQEAHNTITKIELDNEFGTLRIEIMYIGVFPNYKFLELLWQSTIHGSTLTSISFSLLG